MKHNLKITLVLLAMFLVTQFIGIYVVDYYSSTKIFQGNIIETDSPDLPFGLEPPELHETSEFNQMFAFILFAFIIAILLLFFLTKLDMSFIMKLWFFIVVMIALGISFNSLLFNMNQDIEISVLTMPLSWLIALIIALPLAYIKIYKQNFFIHNSTELFIYPGIAAVFVPILNIYTIVALLILISIYDMWAVWHSGIMQKMAKYQMDKLNVFSGFFVPYVSKSVKKKLKKLKKSELKKKKIKVNIAILGGGDVIFPIITAGVMLKTLGIYSSILVIIGATLGLSYLFFMAEKKKFYPAMPYISAGIFLGIILSYLVL